MLDKKRKERSKFKEVERVYFCKYPNCSKGYGRLNHLNDHIRIQKHGEIRKPSEFALVRKQLKRRKLQKEILQETGILQEPVPQLIDQKNPLPPIMVPGNIPSTHKSPLSPIQSSPQQLTTQYPPHIPPPPLPQGHAYPPPPAEYYHYFYQYMLANAAAAAAAAANPGPNSSPPENQPINHMPLVAPRNVLVPALPKTMLPPLQFPTGGTAYLSYEHYQKYYQQLGSPNNK